MVMRVSPDALRGAFVAACETELRALKPGNVHVHAGGHGMTVDDFQASAVAAAEPLCRPGLSVGARIEAAIAATRATVSCNTNLGIVLLAAPLVVAAERAEPGGFRGALSATLAQLTVSDASLAYAAIRLADPGGFGRVEAQDVGGEPTVTLRAAMGLAAERDRVARQYVSDFADIFAIGVAGLAAAERRGRALDRATSEIYLQFLAAFPDSHVARKFGPSVAEAVRADAATLAASLASVADKRQRVKALLDFDLSLKRRGINPGSSADLTVASLLVRGIEPIVDGKQARRDGVNA
jgi:triphosphoribosyl-dephospho-CoA synthase